MTLRKRGASLRNTRLSYLCKNRRLLIGCAIIGLFTISAIAGPFIVPFSPLKQNLMDALAGASGTHLLGTDQYGRDILSRMLWGSRITLTIILMSVIPSALVGVLIGAYISYRKGALEFCVLRCVDVAIAFPGILLAMLIASSFGKGQTSVILSISIYMLPGFIRVSRGAALGVSNLEYVEAARALGASQFRQITRHILPNCLSPIIVHTTLAMGIAVILSSGLSFLGLGIQRPQPEWGLMLSDARQYLRTVPRLALVPGVAITLLVLAFNLVGDGVRDFLDPRRAQGFRNSSQNKSVKLGFKRAIQDR